MVYILMNSPLGVEYRRHAMVQVGSGLVQVGSGMKYPVSIKTFLTLLTDTYPQFNSSQLALTHIILVLDDPQDSLKVVHILKHLYEREHLSDSHVIV